MYSLVISDILRRVFYIIGVIELVDKWTEDVRYKPWYHVQIKTHWHIDTVRMSCIIKY